MNFSADLSLALPQVILAVSALGLLVFGAFAPRQTNVLMVAAMAALGVAGIAAANSPMGRGFSGGLISDSASAFAQVAIYAASALAIPLGMKWFERRDVRNFEFPILILLAALGMGMMVSATNLLTLYVGLELQSLAAYVLASFMRKDQRSAEAGLKYFVLGALASGFLLYGMSMLYGATGSLELAAVLKAIASGQVNHQVLVFGLVFIVAGLAFKIGAVPFHMWIPDVYQGAPTAITLMIGGAPKLAAFAMTIRLLVEGLLPLAVDWQQMLMVLAISSLLIGNLAAVAQTNLKRMLAYSSIAQAGFMLFAILASNSKSWDSIILYGVAYSVATIGMFAVLVKLKDYTYDGFNGLAKKEPLLAFAATIFLFSLAGIPLTGGFMAKYYVLLAVVQQGSLLWLVLFALLMAAVSVYYYFRVIMAMYFKPGEAELTSPVSSTDKLLLIVTCAIVILLGVLPQLVIG